MNRKAQGLSMNTIIIAAIGLAVLVILFAVFTGRIGIFSDGVGQTDANCPAKCSTLGDYSGTESETCDIAGARTLGECCCTPTSPSADPTGGDGDLI